MPVEADDLDELLISVRKTIKDNQQFLQGLVDETIEVVVDPEAGEDKTEEDSDEFEEL